MIMIRGRREGSRGRRRTLPPSGNSPAPRRSRGRARDAGAGVLAAVRATIDRHGLLRPGDRVLAACSGGADSMALLSLLLDLREDLSLDIVVAHFDHRLRAASAADRDFVRAFARERGLRFVEGRRDVRRHAVRRGLNLEEAARELRYAFLRRAASRAGASRIATGHTLNDQAETVLLRILRGTGLSGLAGIPVTGEDGLIRPLLEIERGDILAYLRRRGIPHREDPTNRDRRLLRNRVRHDLLPRLARDYDAAVVRHLGRLALLAQDEDRIMAEAGRKAFLRIAVRESGRLVLDAAKLARLPRGLARRAGREFLRAIKGDLRGFGAADVDTLLDLGPGEARTLAGGILVRRSGDLIVRAAASGRAPAAAYRLEWDGRGEISVPGPGPTFRGRFLRPGRSAPPPFDDASRAVMNAAALRFPLEIRTRRPGDRYRPLGAPGRKTLKEIFREKGIPAAGRSAWPVFVSAGEILWMPGAPVAESVRVDDATRRVFVIEMVGR